MIDGFIVREMFRRCMFKQDKITKLIYDIGNNNYKKVGKFTSKVKTLWSHYEKSGFLSTRILDYLDENTLGLVDPIVIAKLIQTLPDKPFELVSVHDCFRCHPNNGNTLRKQYNTILADINDSILLKFTASQIAKKDLNVNKVGKIDRDVILNGNYLLA